MSAQTSTPKKQKSKDAGRSDEDKNKEKKEKIRKPQILLDPVFKKKVIHTLENGGECFEDEEYGHVCAQRIWEDQS